VDNTILCLFGKKGSGKSTLTKEIVREWPRVIVLDTMSEYNEADKFETAWGFRDITELLQSRCDDRRYKLSLQGFDIEEGLTILELCWEIPDSFIVIEEAGLYSSPSQLPSPVANLVLRGRHREISTLWTSQRPASLNRAITSQADVIIAFRQHEERDVHSLKSVLGDKAEELRNLPDYHIMAYGNRAKFPLAVIERNPELEASPEKSA